MATLQDLVSSLIAQVPSNIPDKAGLERLKDIVYNLDVEIRKAKTFVGPITWESQINNLTVRVSLEKLATLLYCVTYALSQKESDPPVRSLASSFENVLLRLYIDRYITSEEKFDKVTLLKILQPLLELMYKHFNNDRNNVNREYGAIANALNHALKKPIEPVKTNLKPNASDFFLDPAITFTPDEIKNSISKEFVAAVQLQTREEFCVFQLKEYQKTLIDQATKLAASALAQAPKQGSITSFKQGSGVPRKKDESVEGQLIKDRLALIVIALKFLAAKDAAEFAKLYKLAAQRLQQNGTDKLIPLLNEIFLLNPALLPADKLSELALESGQQFLQTKNSRAGEDFTRLYIAAKDKEGMVDLQKLHSLADRVFQASPHLTPPESPVMSQSSSSSSSMSPSSSASVSLKRPSSPSLSKQTPAVERLEYRAAPILNLPSRNLSSSSARISSSLPSTPSVMSPPPIPPKPKILRRVGTAPEANNNNNDECPPSPSNISLKK